MFLYCYLYGTMFKRIGISFCILLAFAVLQAHNLIAHHHEEVQVDHHHHGDNDGHHHHENEDREHQDNAPFNNATHPVDLGKIISKPDGTHISVASPSFIADVLTTVYNRLAGVNNPPRPHPPDKESSLHIIFLSHSLPLRAPPPSSCLS